jgi:excisionase family DNA binding protein
MSEQSKTPNPFELLLEQIRAVVREEIVAANLNGNGNGHSPALLSAEAAAKCFGVPKTWISEAARRGELPSVKLGHYVRFKPEDLESFIKANRSS